MRIQKHFEHTKDYHRVREELGVTEHCSLCCNCLLCVKSHRFEERRDIGYQTQGAFIMDGLKEGLEQTDPALLAMVQRAYESAGGDSAVEALYALSEENRRNKND